MVRSSRNNKEIVAKNKLRQPRSIRDAKSDQRQQLVETKVKIEKNTTRTNEKLRSSLKKAANSNEDRNEICEREKIDEKSQDVASDTGKADKVELKVNLN